jgi:hypothetical protein
MHAQIYNETNDQQTNTSQASLRRDSGAVAATPATAKPTASRAKDTSKRAENKRSFPEAPRQQSTNTTSKGSRNKWHKLLAHPHQGQVATGQAQTSNRGNDEQTNRKHARPLRDSEADATTSTATASKGRGNRRSVQPKRPT